ncbi:Regulatory protein leu3 [Umbelopsis nana]
MKPKACTTCRQRKLKCDAPQRFPQPCSRCNNLKKACIFDANFKRVPKNHRLQQVENELKTIKQTLASGSKTPPMSIVSHIIGATDDEEAEEVIKPCVHAKKLANIHLTAEEVNAIFQLYFERLHIHLPFRMCRSIETIYQVCPLLFWVIVAVTSRNLNMVKDLIPLVKQMVAEITQRPARNVEIVHALLILCMWPFPFHSQLEDPSFIYCGMAMQIGLQIGLHRPEFAYEFNSKVDVLRSSPHIRRTTWIACYVITHMLAVKQGVPCAMPEDYSLLVSFDHILTPVYLAQFGHITRLTAGFMNAIGFSAQNCYGLAEPHERINMIKLYDREFSFLKLNKLVEMDQYVEVVFLTSKLQLYSFALHDDIPASMDLVEIFQKAEATACKLLQLVSQLDLEFTPAHWSRAVIFAGVLLVRILKSPNAGDRNLINNQITLAHQILGSISKWDDDGNERSDRLMLLFSVLEDKKKWPAVQCRSAASLVYDAIRVSKEYYEEILGNLMGQSDQPRQ